MARYISLIINILLIYSWIF